MYYVNKDNTIVTSFTITKTIDCRNEKIANSLYNNLIELENKKNTFEKIKFPDFEFKLEDTTIWYKADYIKGLPLSNKDMISIVWPSCVLRKDTFTIMNYDRFNYLKCVETDQIYFIDLNDCYHSSLIERENLFRKQTKV